ncbi:hypothetical protein [Niveibacterium sp. SC-1]|uniref:DUF4410 domain-containing protein n=1 Tax=Niveibacterium sp. SC-1 TaxID=3135646 RepID=UPI00311DA78E
MKLRLFVSCLAVLAFAAGCASNRSTAPKEAQVLAPGSRLTLKIDVSKSASEEGADIYRQRLGQRLAGAGIVTADPQAPRSLEVVLVTYSMRPPAKRALFGAFAGKDKLQSRVVLKDALTGEVTSEFFVTSQDASSIGSIRGLIEQHADKIVQSLVPSEP